MQPHLNLFINFECCDVKDFRAFDVNCRIKRGEFANGGSGVVPMQLLTLLISFELINLIVVSRRCRARNLAD